MTYIDHVYRFVLSNFSISYTLQTYLIMEIPVIIHNVKEIH